MSQAAPAPSATPSAVAAQVVLVGNPNVGKSVLFGALTGHYATVSNYPGTTVEITQGQMELGGVSQLVIDTPGTNSLLPMSEDERVTRDILLRERSRAVLQVGDAKNLTRTLAVSLQLAEMGLPFVLALNMSDEAASRGIRIEAGKLSEALGVAVVPTVAVRRQGVGRLREVLAEAGRSTVRPAYPRAVEEAVERVQALLPEAPVSARSLAVMLLSGDDSLAPWLRAHVSGQAIEEIERERRVLETSLAQPVGYVVDRARLAAARRLARQVSRPGSAERGGLQRRLAGWTIHPVGGLVVLGVVLVAMYEFVGVFGAGTLVDLLENRLFGGWLVPWVSRGVEALFGQGFVFDLLVGEYGVVSMALTYALALILPIVTTFFLAFGFLEDSGYLPRLAVMLDRLFRVMGLNGKAVLPMVLGLGCDTMATLTARILETRKERLLVILLLALGVPCSAQMTVVLAMLAGLSWTAAALWVGVVVGVLFLVGYAASKVLPGRGSDFVLELPPLRLPGLGNIAVKTLGRLEWYLREAVPLFVLGTLVLFVADRLALIGSLQRTFSPVVQGLLGLPAQATEAFLIGFLRRDFGAAGLYELARAGTMDTVGVVVAVTTITLFMPCIANLFMIIKEQGWRVALAVSAFVLPFALAVGGLMNLVLRALGASFGGGP